MSCSAAVLQLLAPRSIVREPAEEAELLHALLLPSACSTWHSAVVQHIFWPQALCALDTTPLGSQIAAL